MMKRIALVGQKCHQEVLMFGFAFILINGEFIIIILMLILFV